MGTRLTVGWWAVTATAVAAACFLGGCKADRLPTVRPGEPSSPQLVEIGGRIETDAAEIRTDAADIKAQTEDPGFVPAIGLPAIGAKADSITANATDIQALGAKVTELSVAVKAGEKAAASLIRDNDRLKAENDKLKADRNSTLARWLAFLAVGAVIGAAVSLFLIKSFSLAGMFGALFAVAISAQWLLAWAMWIALGVGVLLIGGSVWVFVIQRKSLGQVIQTVEKLKPELSDVQRERLKLTARAVQTWGTRTIVDKIRGAAKPQKAK